MKQGINALRNGLIIFGLALVLAGCGSKVTPENLDKVNNGMTRQEVKSILGKPSREDSSSMLGMSGSIWIYQHGQTEVKITFINDGVIHKEGTFQN